MGTNASTKNVDKWVLMGYKWDMISGRDAVKEMKIRLNSSLHKELSKVAKESFRSVTKQVAVYIRQGIDADRKKDRKPA